ncbi:MAG: hypothetical protein EHM35_15505 [Planctomycetaceae bacterium]|nr:MAG: hypothetical protein EHM35_15505 [Planctomycetaceae bacterium]
MKRSMVLFLICVMAATLGAVPTRVETANGLTVFILAQTDRTYSLSDLPGGWGWDVTKIQGTLIPALHDPIKPTNDPNLWLIPCGPLVRWGPTNDWVKEVRIISVIGTDPNSVAVYVDQDVVTKKSRTWRLEVSAVPGPWYIVVDAVSQPGKNGQSKLNRYTVAGAGYVPDDYLPFLW